jgi:type I restriction enzyme S subunit
MTQPLVLHAAEETLEAVRTSRHAAYPAYRPSGIEWFGDVPEHWTLTPLKHLTRFLNGMAFKPEQWSDEGYAIIRIENLNGGDSFNCFDGEVPSQYHVRQGDLLFGWSGNRGTSFGPFLWWREGLHYLNQHIFKLYGYECNKSWFYWTLKSLTIYMEEEAHGIIGMVHITKGKLGAVKVPVPPPEEQRAIARFLDEETRKIDDLIEAKRSLLDLLKEKRQAVITHAVTRGLDPAAKLKPSGVEWLGDMPEHWGVLALRRHLRSIEQGWSPIAEDRFPVGDEWGVLKLSAVKNGRFFPEESKTLSSDTSTVPEFEVRDGDFLITRANTPGLVGEVCVVSNPPSRLLLSDLIYRIEIDESDLVPEYLSYWLRSGPGRHEITRDARGSSQSMVKVAQTHIRGWIIPTPSREEQRELIEYLDAETSRIDNLTRKLENHTALLREYRSALISAAVTGKIDVREEGV